MDKQPTDLLANYVHRLRFEDLPGEVVESAKLVLLDYLASAMAGYKINRIFNEALWSVVSDMGGKKESRVLFQGARLPAPHAALMNAAYGHGADLDDGNRTAQGHPGVGTIPAVLALAEAHGLSGRDVIVAIVAGYDIFVRMATALNPSHLSRGFHTTGTIGTIAAAGAAAKALKLPLAGVRNALSLAALQAAGLLEVAESGQMAKPFHPAKAAFNAILAARLAEKGAEGPREPLEGRKGFIKAFADQADLDALRKDLGKKFRISSCYIKLYPACRHTHGAIDAALKLRQDGGFSLNALKAVKVHIYPAAINLTGSIYQTQERRRGEVQPGLYRRDGPDQGTFHPEGSGRGKGTRQGNPGGDLQARDHQRSEAGEPGGQPPGGPGGTGAEGRDDPAGGGQTPQGGPGGARDRRGHGRTSCGSAPKTFCPRRGSGRSSRR